MHLWLYSTLCVFRIFHMLYQSGVRLLKQLQIEYSNYRKRESDMFVMPNTMLILNLYSKVTRYFKLMSCLNCNAIKSCTKKIQDKLHSYHSGQLKTNYETKSTHTRQIYHVNMHIHNNLSKINSINHKVGSSWNQLPIGIKKLAFKSVPTFIKHAKNMYLSKYAAKCNLTYCNVCKSDWPLYFLIFVLIANYIQCQPVLPWSEEIITG